MSKPYAQVPARRMISSDELRQMSDAFKANWGAFETSTDLVEVDNPMRREVRHRRGLEPLPADPDPTP